MCVQWYDRTIVKENFSLWRKNGNPFMLVHVSDTQEMQDIKKWIEQNAAPLFPVSVAYPSDYAIFKHELLRELTDELGGKDKFPEFFKEFNKDIPEFVSRIRQGVAENASSGGPLEATNINQQAVIQISSMPSLEELRERDIPKLFDLFLKDFEKLCGSQQTLFIFQFKKQGFQAFTPDFKRWFQKFCKTLSRKGHTKFCVLNQGDSNELRDIDTEFVETVSEVLMLDDILHETGDKSFCYGIIDQEKNCIKYSEFKRRWDFFQKTCNTER